MIYKFRIWVYKPVTTEIFVDANSDDHAKEIVNKLDSDTFNWQECQITPDRVTYEVIKSDENS
jgi:predicted nucleic acid-binding protein|tara:strand:- start:363 stop:551 length:189 start_codon:yes stop_codon:yes gene_type:complete